MFETDDADDMGKGKGKGKGKGDGKGIQRKRDPEDLKAENRVRAKLNRMHRSERLSKFLSMSKLWSGSKSQQKKLVESWLAADGNEEKIEAQAALTMKASISRQRWKRR